MKTNNQIDSSQIAKEAVEKVIVNLMNSILNRVLLTDPFIKENHRSSKPLYAALVPDEIFKGSHFERRFTTSFGGVWEKLAQIVGKAYHGECTLGEKIEGTIGNESLRRIQEVLNKLETKTKTSQKLVPNWDSELDYIRSGGGEQLPVTVTCDLLIKSERTGLNYAFELKAPLPNSDQTKVSKEKMFKLLCMEQKPVDNAYYALVYNPYGEKEKYNWAFPQRWFNMQNDSSVLIGDEFWDLIGGDGTYRAFVTEIDLLGQEYKERIYRDFLNIEPPVDTSQPQFKLNND